MKINVVVKTKSKKELVEKLPDGSFLVRVHAIPEDGQANKRVIELLADFLDRPKTSINLVSGHKSKKKIFELL